MNFSILIVCFLKGVDFFLWQIFPAWVCKLFNVLIFHSKIKKIYIEKKNSFTMYRTSNFSITNDEKCDLSYHSQINLLQLRLKYHQTPSIWCHLEISSVMVPIILSSYPWKWSHFNKQVDEIAVKRDTSHESLPISAPPNISPITTLLGGTGWQTRFVVSSWQPRRTSTRNSERVRVDTASRCLTPLPRGDGLDARNDASRIPDENLIRNVYTTSEYSDWYRIQFSHGYFRCNIWFFFSRCTK